MFGLAAIGGVVGKIFGTDKAITSVVDGAKSALDKLVYTSEEKADDTAKSVTEARTMVIDWLKNTQGQNISRRCIALVVTSIWAFNIVLIQILTVASVWVESASLVDGTMVPVINTSTKCLESAKLLSETGSTISSAMMLVLAFYFAAPQMGKFADVALKKFSGKSS